MRIAVIGAGTMGAGIAYVAAGRGCDVNLCDASNITSLSVAELSHHCSMSERFAGLHFFNPVRAVKLVEIVPSAGLDLLVRA